MKKRMLALFLALTLVSGSFSGITSGANAGISTVYAAEETIEKYLSDLEWESQSCGSADFPEGTAKDTAVNGEKMQLLVDGQAVSFEKGLGTHAPSEIVYDISDMGCTRFEAYAGVDYQCLDDFENLGEGIIDNLIVEIDGEIAAQSGMINPSMDAYHFTVTVPEGAEELTLTAVEGENNWSDWVIWADAKITAQNAGNEGTSGITIDPVCVNDLTFHVSDGKILLYLGEIPVAQSASLGSAVINGTKISDFKISGYEIQEEVSTERGPAARVILEMTSKKTDIVKTVWYDLLYDIEGAICTTTYFQSPKDVTVTKITENEFSLIEPDQDRIWSYNGGGEGSQSFYDTLQKVNQSFYRENKQDETAAGIPVADIYSVHGGIAVGDASLYRRFLTTPVKGGKNTATVGIQWQEAEIKANENTEAGTAILSVHNGDYYCGLRTYAKVMEAQGFAVPDEIPDSSYELRWESWGWEGAWTIEKILGKLDELYAQGIRQITLDDCWYTAAGDWELNPDKFPNGTEDMRRLTDAVHEKGMTIVLWWRPMDGGRDRAFSVISGHTQQPSKLLQEHPEYFVKNQDGSFAKLSGPGSSNSFNGSTGYALCPYSEGAVKAQTEFIRRAMTEWGIDGFKSDYVWGMPKCYNEEHDHSSPKESTEMASENFYRAIYEEMTSIDPEAFHLLCNCGTPQDYYSFPYVTQIPTADPTSVDQTRRRVKAYKALAGDGFPITTDHNEIWYPSTVGTGAILIEKRDFADGSAQEKEYSRWLAIAEEHQLYRGRHIGDLYSYGIDAYETYVIEKDGMMYYSFYRDGKKYAPTGNPEVVLKGLNPNITYRIEDYVNDRVIAECIAAEEAVFSEKFSSYLLLRAVPLEELADYTAVDEALGKIPEDLTRYTEESVAMLEDAVNAVVRDLGEKSQAEVDEMAEAIENAVKGLKYDGVERIYGTSRYTTSFGLGDQLKKEFGVEKFDHVIIASGTKFADALSGSYLAVVKKAPIIIVNSEKPDTMKAAKDFLRNELDENGTVYILGGTSAVSKEMENGLNYRVVRLAGKDRYETNLKILEEAGVEGKDILIATGKSFADSLSASAAGLPILLVGNQVTNRQKALLESAGQKIVLGGTGAVSDEVMKAVGAKERLGGKTRYETSVMIAERLVKHPKGAVLAYASKFPDGLCGGPLAYATNSPLILTKPGNTEAAGRYVQKYELKGGIVIGGTSLISEEAVDSIFP